MTSRKTYKPQTHTPEAPKFVKDHIQDVRVDAQLHREPALVDVNAPLALIQCTGEGHIQGIGWMLRQPLYAAAPDLLNAAREALAAVTDDGESAGPDWAYIERVLRAAIAKATGQEGK